MLPKVDAATTMPMVKSPAREIHARIMTVNNSFRIFRDDSGEPFIQGQWQADILAELLGALDPEKPLNMRITLSD